MTGTHRPWTHRAAILPLVLAVGLAAACGDDDDGGGGSGDGGSSEGAACDELRQLQEDVTSLGDVDVQAGTSGLSDAFGRIGDDLDALADEVGDEAQPEIDALKAELEDLETAITDVSTVGVSGVVDAVQAVTSAAGDLARKVESTSC